ncbi:MAG: TIM barrel protein [Candidatus Dojkabacteria bacterium]|nr:MAG: TIM barrel protein [Candidatus Dojkabacteria bacterium]
MKNNNTAITYNYQSIERKTRNTALRYLFGKLGVQFLKSIFQFIPGIDNSIYKKGASDTLFVEIVPSFLGMFTKHWEIKMKTVTRFLSLGVSVRSMHAPWIDDGKIYQTARKSYLENVLDLTENVSATWNCLFSHVQLYSVLAPKEQEKVLIVHPLPAKPGKTEKEMIQTISAVVKKTLPVLQGENVRLVVENMPWLKKHHEEYTAFLGDALFFDRLMNEVNSPFYGVLFDWGHANSFSRFMTMREIKHREHFFSEEALSQFEYQNYFIKRLTEKIFYGHLSFNEAHVKTAKAPFYAKNYDSHYDLTWLQEDEYLFYRKNVLALAHCPSLVGMTIESIPSYVSRRKRIQRYRDSVEILNSMLQSGS